MDSKPSLLAAAGLLAILPAGLFMIALVVRNLPQPELARASEQLVMWYSARMWTLWLLLLLLPMAAFFTGCATLVQGLKPRLPVAGVTAIAALILAIVVLHMAAN